MTPERLSILYVSQMPPSPPRFGAQARMHGLMTNLARRHDITAVSLVDAEFNLEDCRRAMGEYCRQVILIPNPNARSRMAKRLLQVRSTLSIHSFEHHRYSVAALQEKLDQLLRQTRFDVVNLEFPYLAHFRFRQAPAGAPAPPLVIDTHEIAYDMVRQFARSGASGARSLYAGLNWRKLRREELAAFRSADGICTCSVADQQRLLADLPWARTVVIPNAADVEFYQPRSAYPPSDGRTVVFFGLMSTFPNIDGVLWFLREIWPPIAAERTDARCKIIGANPPASVQSFAGPRVEVTGFVEDLRPHLASAAVLVVPLRLGGGTRLKIIEGMAMSKAIVSTGLGAEGLDATPGSDILIANDPASFSSSVIRLLDDQPLAARLGRAARQLAVAKYAWSTAATSLERFYREIFCAR
jgi:polysaccharide biosynthesis protein PslH